MNMGKGRRSVEVRWVCCWVRGAGWSISFSFKTNTQFQNVSLYDDRFVFLKYYVYIKKTGARFTKHFKLKIFVSSIQFELTKILSLRCLVKRAPGLETTYLN